MQSKYALVYPYVLKYLSQKGIKNFKNESHIRDLIGILDKKQIIVVQGTYDHIENIFNQSDIPHTLINEKDIKDFEFKSNTILFCNCAGTSYSNESTTKIRNLMNQNVIRTLVTTDWCGVNTLKQVLDEGDFKKIGNTSCLLVVRM